MIEIKDLHKSFDDKVVLKGICSRFENGKTNLIIGQSGSGKTVLMKCIVGLLEPTAGNILYDNRSLVRMNKRERALLRREMGMIFQSGALFDSMTVLENVMFPPGHVFLRLIQRPLEASTLLFRQSQSFRC